VKENAELSVTDSHGYNTFGDQTIGMFHPVNPKFGPIATENCPVIFTSHKNDEIVYSPTEPSLGELHGPLKIPEAVFLVVCKPLMNKS
jgi:hypothetical protein